LIVTFKVLRKYQQFTTFLEAGGRQKNASETANMFVAPHFMFSVVLNLGIDIALHAFLTALLLLNTRT
jgi:hypothetical protein